MKVKKRHLVLIGFSGSGKSTIGPLLAKKLNCLFFDIDEQIVKNQKKTIAEIFKTSGEKYFRNIEAQVINKAVTSKKMTVIALGGGAFQRAETQKKIREMAIVVYLSCAQKELYRRLIKKTDRPLMPQTGSELKEKIRTLSAKRLKNYQKADFIIATTDKTTKEVIQKIMMKINHAYY